MRVNREPAGRNSRCHVIFGDSTAQQSQCSATSSLVFVDLDATMNEAQALYWNREGATKTFTHPVNLDWLQKHLEPKARILDYGCGYGRVTALLSEQGYQVVGVDAAAAMIEKARTLHPNLPFRQITPPVVPFPDGFFDAAALFAVLTCIPDDGDQIATINELQRVVRPGGLVYVSDYWLQRDKRNRDRYAQHERRCRTYGVFELSEGVAVRHHSREWIAELLHRWEPVAVADIKITTMNNHEAAGFQWLGRRLPQS
jgi:SAM-dependent methyltransferase